MAITSLEDIGGLAQAKHTKKSKKPKKARLVVKSTAKKAKVIAKSTAKKSKSARVVSKSTVKKSTALRPISSSKTAEATSHKTDYVSSDEQLAKLDQQLHDVLQAVPEVVRQENAQVEEYIVMFQTCRKLARTAERKYFTSRSGRDLYPLMQVYNQMRDIIADLRAIRDVGQLGDVLNEEILNPFAQSAGTTIVDIRQKLAAWFKSNLDESSISEANLALDKIIRAAAQEMTKSYHDSLEKTVQVFSNV